MVLGRVMFRYSRYRRCNVRNRKVSGLDHLALQRIYRRRETLESRRRDVSEADDRYYVETNHPLGTS